MNQTGADKIIKRHINNEILAGGIKQTNKQTNRKTDLEKVALREFGGEGKANSSEIPAPLFDSERKINIFTLHKRRDLSCKYVGIHQRRLS